MALDYRVANLILAILTAPLLLLFVGWVHGLETLEVGRWFLVGGVLVFVVGTVVGSLYAIFGRF